MKQKALNQGQGGMDTSFLLPGSASRAERACKQAMILTSKGD